MKTQCLVLPYKLGARNKVEAQQAYRYFEL